MSVLCHISQNQWFPVWPIWKSAIRGLRLAKFHTFMLRAEMQERISLKPDPRLTTYLSSFFLSCPHPRRRPEPWTGPDVWHPTVLFLLPLTLWLQHPPPPVAPQTAAASSLAPWKNIVHSAEQAISLTTRLPCPSKLPSKKCQWKAVKCTHKMPWHIQVYTVEWSNLSFI